MGAAQAIDSDGQQRCGHCGGPVPPDRQPSNHHPKVYCSIECRKSAAHMRNYWSEDRAVHAQAMERRQLAAAAWRHRMEREGRCVRCGRDNDRAYQNLKLCTNCIIALKGGP